MKGWYTDAIHSGVMRCPMSAPEQGGGERRCGVPVAHIRHESQTNAVVVWTASGHYARMNGGALATAE